jgi:hexosaminidase
MKTFLIVLIGLLGVARADPFAIRGFHLDLRIQVMKMPALKQFASQLSQNGINTLIVEWEGTYPYRQDPLIANRYAYTREEVAGFIRYCGQIGITVIPLQQSFGHVEYILRHDKYEALREDEKDLSQVCPSEVALNKALFTRLYSDLVTTHPGPYIHIGGDETYLLGHCEKCRKRAAEVGLSRLYFDHIKMLCDIVVGLGKRPVLWADIALKYPEYIHLLPRQTVFIDWNYGWAADHFGSHRQLVNSGYEVWGAPAIRSDPDNYYLTCWQKHFGNIRDFIPFCRSMGYKGIVMTSWSTSGAYSPVYDSEDALLDLYAIRHVYPVSGFNMLIAAYEQAIADTVPLDVDGFIDRYARERYGFNATGARRLRMALFTAPFKVRAAGIHTLLDSARWAARMLHSLQPSRNAGEYAHYCLMADIRVYYLSFMEIETALNDPAVEAKDIGKYIPLLDSLRSEQASLDRTFIRLNGDLLYPFALAEENQLRNERVDRLYQRLKRIR